MAVTRNDKSSVLKLAVVTGKKSDGSDKTATRTINKINPELTDEQALSIAQKIGNLQAYTVNAFNRVDTGTLANAAEG